MRRLWLIFAQTVTVTLGVIFALNVFGPDWLRPAPGKNGEQIVVQQGSGLPAAAPSGASPAPLSYADAAARSMPSVVHVFTRNTVQVPRHPLFDDPIFRHFFGNPHERLPRQETAGLGSGVIVSSNGYILTNNHVIESAGQIEVALNDGRKFPAQVVGRDPESDLAVLRLDTAEGLQAISFAAQDTLRIGDAVLAIGNPFGVGQTVTMGIVSALGRSRLGINTFENYIQTDAAINPGNSGGALVDASGALVGINTAIYSRTGGSLGIGFAIPASLALDVFSQIIADGQVTRGWIGVEIQDITPELAASFGLPTEQGALIAGVLRDSPAERGGIRPGDVLTHIDGQAIHSAREIIDLISARSPGEQAALRLLRERRERETRVEIGTRPMPLQER